MALFVKFHPVIFQMDELGEQKYLIYERLIFIFIPITFKYKAELYCLPITSEIRMKAIVFKLVEIEISFKLLEKQGGTEVEETINFKTVLPIKSILKFIFKKQHSHLFSNIQKANTIEML